MIPRHTRDTATVLVGPWRGSRPAVEQGCERLVFKSSVVETSAPVATSRNTRSTLWWIEAVALTGGYELRLRAVTMTFRNAALVERVDTLRVLGAASSMAEVIALASRHRDQQSGRRGAQPDRPH